MGESSLASCARKATGSTVTASEMVLVSVSAISEAEDPPCAVVAVGSTAVSVAALTVVDMVKAVDKAAVITDVRVLAKSGGRRGDWVREADA